MSCTEDDPQLHGGTGYPHAAQTISCGKWHSLLFFHRVKLFRKFLRILVEILKIFWIISTIQAPSLPSPFTWESPWPSHATKALPILLKGCFSYISLMYDQGHGSYDMMDGFVLYFTSFAVVFSWWVHTVHKQQTSLSVKNKMKSEKSWLLLMRWCTSPIPLE